MRLWPLGKENKGGTSYDWPSLLPAGSFQAVPQGQQTQTEPIIWLSWRIKAPKSRGIKVVRVIRVSHRRKPHRKSRSVVAVPDWFNSDQLICMRQLPDAKKIDGGILSNSWSHCKAGTRWFSPKWKDIVICRPLCEVLKTVFVLKLN